METDQDEIMPNHATQITTHPKWVQQLIQDGLEKLSTIQNAIIKKENVITKLDDHMAKETVPPSLRIKLKIMVTEEQQQNMDKILAEATNSFNEKILCGLKEVRREELKSLREKAEHTVQTWKQELHTTISQMKEEKIIQPSSSDLTETLRIFNDFKTKRAEQEKTLRTTDFHHRKKLMKQQEQLQERKQQQNLDRTLTDPNFTALQEQIERLSEQVALLSKKGQAKPVSNNKKGNGGGTHRMRDNKRSQMERTGQTKTNGPPKKRSTANHQTGNQDDSGTGNQRTQFRSRNSTRPSGSSRKNSRARLN